MAEGQMGGLGFLAAIVTAGLVMIIAIVGFLMGMITLAVMLGFVIILVIVVLLLVAKMAALVFFVTTKDPKTQGAEVSYGLDEIIGTGDTQDSRDPGPPGDL